MSKVKGNATMKNLEADIVVVGGGGGGLTAAVRAAEGGAKVVLLEKTDILGGASLMAGGISSVNSKIQVAAGTSESLKEQLFSAMMNESRWLAHPGVVRRMVNTTGIFADWVNAKDPGSVKTFLEHRFIK